MCSAAKCESKCFLVYSCYIFSVSRRILRSVNTDTPAPCARRSLHSCLLGSKMHCSWECLNNVYCHEVGREEGAYESA